MTIENNNSLNTSSLEHVFDISKHPQLKKLEDIANRAINGYARCIFDNLPVDDGKNFKDSFIELIKKERLLSDINLRFTSWLLENEVRKSIEKNYGLSNFQKINKLNDFIDKLILRIQSTQQGNPISTAEGKKEDELSDMLLSASKEASDAHDDKMLKRLKPIYEAYRALTDNLTSEWAEWTISSIVELETDEKEKTKLLERLVKKLLETIHDAPLVKE